MNHDQKKTVEHKSLESKGQMKPDSNVLYIVRKIFLRDITYGLHILKIDLIWERYEWRNFGTTRNPKKSDIWM
jgi:hypothetical protein